MGKRYEGLTPEQYVRKYCGDERVRAVFNPRALDTGRWYIEQKVLHGDHYSTISSSALTEAEAWEKCAARVEEDTYQAIYVRGGYTVWGYQPNLFAAHVLLYQGADANEKARLFADFFKVEIREPAPSWEFIDDGRGGLWISQNADGTWNAVGFDNEYTHFIGEQKVRLVIKTNIRVEDYDTNAILRYTKDFGWSLNDDNELVDDEGCNILYPEKGLVEALLRRSMPTDSQYFTDMKYAEEYLAERWGIYP